LLGMVVHSYNPNYTGSKSGKIKVQSRQAKAQNPIWKTNYKQKGRGCDSSGRALA
jgi:hypothetical protein